MMEAPLDLDVINNFVLRRSSIIEASAGTGKTFNITYMVLRLLLGPTCKDDASALDAPLNIENILVVTFTRSATAELRDRIRGKIRTLRIIFEKLSKLPVKQCFLPQELSEKQLSDLIKNYLGKDDAQVLNELLADPKDFNEDISLSKEGQLICKLKARVLLKAERNIDTAAIRTIHSFCNSVINQIYAFEAGEPFSTELSDDISPQYHEACAYVFRKLFYQNKNADLLLSIIGIPNENAFASSVNILKKVRLLGKNNLTAPLYNIHGYAVRLGGNTLLNLTEKTREILFDNKLSYKKQLDSLLNFIKQRQLQNQEEALKLLYEWNELYKSAITDSSVCLNGTDYKLNKVPFVIIKNIKESADCLDTKDNHKLLCDLFDAIIKGQKQSLHALENFMRKGKNGLSDKELSNDFSLFKERTQALSLALEKSFGALEYVSIITMLISFIIIDKTDEICRQNQLMSNDDLLYKLAKALRMGKKGKELSKAVRRRYRIAIIDEFQDTDPIQLDIFSNIYLDASYVNAIKNTPALGSYCYIIGDPKQSIYAFRSADINSYIKAKNTIRKIAEPLPSVYSLKKNFRSAPDVIEGINAIYSQEINPQNENPFESDPKDVSFVKAQGVKGKSAFYFNEDKTFKSGNFISIVNTKNFNNLQEAQAKKAAFDIYRCLTCGHITQDPQEKIHLDTASFDCNVHPDDITVLVSNAKEYELIAKALKSYNIPCVYYSDKTSVLKAPDKNFNEQARPSLEVSNMIYLMEAMLDCFNQNKILRLLGSDLLKNDAQGFIESQSNEFIENEVKLLQDCEKLWERWGFLTAFLKWFKDPLHKGLKTFLSLQNGERELTNYLHIAEIIQKFHVDTHGANAQMRKFLQLVEDELEKPQASGLTQKRLESESRQVRVYTIHKSKGLEFPLVFMPFIWGERKKTQNKGPFVYYDENNKIMAYTYDDVSEIVDKASSQENVRLLYVALTRAASANFIYLGTDDDVKAIKNPNSLNKLLGKNTSTKNIVSSLTSLKFKKDEIEAPLFEDISDCFENNAEYKADVDLKINDLCKPSVLQNKISYNFIISSYSDIVSGLYGNDPNDNFENENYEERLDPDRRFIFPKGTQAGSFLHEMMQNCAFEKINDDTFRENFVLDCINDDYHAVTAAWDIGDPKNIPEQLDLKKKNLSLWLYNITHADLSKAVNQDKDFTLSHLNKGQYIPEMEFLIPVTSKKTYQSLNEMCKLNALNENIDPNNLVLAKDKENTLLSGYITGSIDLVFCLNNRFYVIDYKSNYLGNHKEDYSQKTIGDNVFSPHHRYDMQYLIYSVALQRFLRSRLGDLYNFDTHFGGVIYLYFRGLYQNEQFGVFSTHPQEKTVNDFEKLLNKED